MPMLWAKALRAYLPVLNELMSAFDLTDAVAPVKMRVGGWVEESWLDTAAARRRNGMHA